jgi:hypothetical protein
MLSYWWVGRSIRMHEGALPQTAHNI